jgi:hypothetical protein
VRLTVSSAIVEDLCTESCRLTSGRDSSTLHNVFSFQAGVAVLMVTFMPGQASFADHSGPPLPRLSRDFSPRALPDLLAADPSSGPSEAELAERRRTKGKRQLIAGLTILGVLGVGGIIGFAASRGCQTSIDGDVSSCAVVTGVSAASAFLGIVIGAPLAIAGGNKL